MLNFFKRKKKLDYKLISDPTKSINLDNNDLLISYSVGFFTGITVGGNRCDKESVELARKLIRLLRERGLDGKVFSSYSFGGRIKFDLDHIQNPLNEGYIPKDVIDDVVPSPTNGCGVGKRGNI